MRRAHIVLLTSALPGGPLHEAFDLLTHDYPPSSVTRVQLAGDGRNPASPRIIESVRNAAYVVIQEPADAPEPEHVAAAAAARACGVPLLLVSPAGSAVTRLARLADVEPSRVVFYPARADDQGAWEAFREELAGKSADIARAYEHARRGQYLEPITQRLSTAADILDHAAPSEEVAWAIARVFDAQTSSIVLENHVDFLQITFPAPLYTHLLNQLTTNFRSVRTIADPVAEQLPWDDPVDRESLATVAERIFVIDEGHARQYGLEAVLNQLSLALQAARGTVSVAGLTTELRRELDQISAANSRLKGLNRFYAGSNIVGGYADESGEHVRLLAYHDAGHNSYLRETEMLAKVESLRRTTPADRSHDTTALASWIYSNVLPEPRLESIHEYDRSTYADDYDGNIVRVTPGYYAQLDALAAEFKRALIALYAPFSGRDRNKIRVLELGVGTGALTGRLLRVCTRFCDEVRGDRGLAERPVVEIDGWDSNPRMVEIASHRLVNTARQRADTSLQPNLQLVEFDRPTTGRRATATTWWSGRSSRTTGPTPGPTSRSSAPSSCRTSAGSSTRSAPSC